MSKVKKNLLAQLEEIREEFVACRVVDQAGNVYPLGSDTKVLSTVFELISRPAVYAVAQQLSCEVEEPRAQNYYPDFTLMRGRNDKRKIAIDVKTDYSELFSISWRERPFESFHTLGPGALPPNTAAAA